MNKVAIDLGTVQETLLVTLWARAVEANQPDPILSDRKSVEIFNQVNYDFSRLAGVRGSQVGICLRGQFFDRWVTSFLDQHPDGIVVELGSGLNTRFERVDNGSVLWVDLDLPDSMSLRRQFFTDSDRRQSIAASVLDASWVETVKAIGSRPTLFLAEGVLMYLSETEVQQLLAMLLEQFPRCLLAFDSISPFMVKYQKYHDIMRHFDARFQWGIDRINDIQAWNPGYQVLEIKTLRDVPVQYYKRLGIGVTLLTFIPLFNNAYRLSLVRIG